MKIMSISSSHDASLCVVKDGVVDTYFKSERYTKVKHDNNYDVLIEVARKNNLFYDLDYLLFSNGESKEVKIRQDYELLSYAPSCTMVEPEGHHHLFHAAHAFYASGFKKSLVITIDSAGAFLRGVDNKPVEAYECTSVYEVSYPHRFKPLYKRYMSKLDDNTSVCMKTKQDVDFEMHKIYHGLIDIGNLYNCAAIAIGSDPDNCGKAMGLSSYGKSIPNFNLRGEDVYKNIKQYFKDYPKLLRQLFTEAYDSSSMLQMTEDNYQPFANFCHEVQRQCQEQVIDIVDKYVSLTGIKNVCISGGYAMNIITNYELLQKYPDINFYFDPVCDDSNLSIGTCLYTYRCKTKDMKIYPEVTTSYHGVLHHAPVAHKDCKVIRASIKDVAILLSKNRSVAVFYGQAEAGQRALGNRSILFNALNPEAKDIVNKIKKREWYRPFAAMVLESDAHLYFDNVIPNPHMTSCFPVISDIIPGVTHVDGTCRIQTVNSDHFLHDLLLEFKNITGHGILLNTSFNLAGEPLVEAPEDALNTLCSSLLDYLWFFENKRLFKSNL